LTNKRLIFHIKEGNLYRGLELIVEGADNAHIESLEIPLEEINGVEKKSLAIEVYTNSSIFREIQGKKGLFGPKGYGREFENGPSIFRFNVHIFVNKNEWINEITYRKNALLTTFEQTQQKTFEELPSEPEPYSQGTPIVREKIVIREIIKIKCRYCGTLNDQTIDKCPNCGAKI
jgi:rubrerythrin